jgi:chromosomal replication initiator protein
LSTRPTETAQLQATWSEVLERIRTRVPDGSFNTWFGHTSLASLDDDAAEVGVGSLFIKEMLQDHYRTVIGDALQEVIGSRPRLGFRIDGPAFRRLRQAQEADGLAEAPPTPAAPAAPARSAPAPAAVGCRLDDFIAGVENELALGACRRAVTHPGDFNPLLLIGASGLGKTHLLQGVQRLAEAQREGLEARFCTAEDFTRAFGRAVEQRHRGAFRQRFEECDLLLLDDLQFLARNSRRKTQEELLHVLDALLRTGAQVMLAADAPVEEMTELLPRLRERLQGGLTVLLEPPREETRQRLVQAKARRRGLSLAPEVATAVAERLGPSVRELEGAVARLAALSDIGGQHLDARLVEAALPHRVAPEPDAGETPSLAAVAEATAASFGVELERLRGRRRTEQVREARAAAMLLARELTGASFDEIGGYFDGRSHATVLSAVRKARQRYEDDSPAARRVEALRRRFAAPSQKRLW